MGLVFCRTKNRCDRTKSVYNRTKIFNRAKLLKKKFFCVLSCFDYRWRTAKKFIILLITHIITIIFNHLFDLVDTLWLWVIKALAVFFFSFSLAIGGVTARHIGIYGWRCGGFTYNIFVSSIPICYICYMTLQLQLYLQHQCNFFSHFYEHIYNYRQSS